MPRSRIAGPYGNSIFSSPPHQCIHLFPFPEKNLVQTSSICSLSTLSYVRFLCCLAWFGEERGLTKASQSAGRPPPGTAWGHHQPATLSTRPWAKATPEPRDFTERSVVSQWREATQGQSSKDIPALR